MSVVCDALVLQVFCEKFMNKTIVFIITDSLN